MQPASRLAPGLLAAGLALVLAGSYLSWRHLPAGPAPAVQPGKPEFRTATLLNDRQSLPAFSLARQGGSFGNAQLQGRWTLMYFGYTYCPDICPTALTTLKGVVEALAARKQALPQVLMVSVDPARDSPEKLAGFTAFFDPGFIGATAPDAALAPLVKHLGVFFERHDPGKAGQYVVDHSDAVYLIDPAGRLKAVFAGPRDVPAMVADYLALTG